MAYQVLARKWRPRSFAEMVGQTHVLRALVHALDQQRLHHAFLFTGTRGVGKTTLARILAKSLNCDVGVSSTPCGTCSSCREIDEGRFVDLIEVDAASRTGVDDTRELLENVQYTPTRGRYKVYLIDEVHMFSKSSFNALLKTLEEPPPHVKFLLATTDPQKLPLTVLSRCLQFNLRPLPVDLIRDHLARILEQEGIPSEAPAVAALAQAADGSMRDGLSLLDQAIAYGGGRLRANEVQTMLGTIARERIHTLLELLAAGDAPGVLAAVDELAQQAPDYAALLAELLTLLQRVAVAQLVPESVDDTLGDGERIQTLAGLLAPEDIQLYYQIGLIGRRDLPLAPQPRGGFEMILLRMLAFRPAPASADVGPPVTAPAEAGGPSVSASAPGVHGVPPVSAAPERPAQRHAPAVSAVDREGDETESDRGAPALDWGALVGTLNLSGAVQQLALNCVMQRREGNTLYLLLDHGHKHWAGKERERRLEQVLRDALGQPVRVVVALGRVAQQTPADALRQVQADREEAARQAIAQDPNVQALRETFDAEVNPNSIRPLE